MAYELRRVPPGWEHPRHPETGEFVPLYGEPFEVAHARWSACPGGPHGDEPEPQRCDLSAPQRGAHVPFGAADATHWQIYEDTTEGTPVSPVFPEKDHARLWLITTGLDPENAAAFVELGHVPFSLTLTDGTELRGFETAAVVLRAMRERKERLS